MIYYFEQMKGIFGAKQSCNNASLASESDLYLFLATFLTFTSMIFYLILK